MIPLPIDEFLPRIAQSLAEHRNLVLVAEPGAGKTTRVPPAVLPVIEDSRHRGVIMLQPRRVAARAAAARIADERNWRVGGQVGYHIRFDRVIGRETRLRVLTEGILTRQLLDDPFLDGIGCVILDEFHERSIHIDLALAMLREVQRTVRPDLRLIVMSATLDAEPVTQFLDDAPVLRVPGRLFPVDIEHRARPPLGQLPDAVCDALRDVLSREPRGDVLIFLPGVREINSAIEAAVPLAREHDMLLVPLHGSLAAEQQFRALQPAAKRKVIFATNIAETSLTIDGVTCVIDTGLARVAGYDAQRGMDTLSVQRISQASAAQRAGRAGRTAAGRCVRLWSAKEHHQLQPFDKPEMARVDLAATVLALHAWGANDPRAFGFFESPPQHMLAAAERLLWMLGALDAGKITPLGRRMLTIPAHPRLARLLLAAADAGLLEAGALIAALLSEKDIVRDDLAPPSQRRARTRADSDISLRIEWLERRDPSLDRAAVAQVLRARDQLRSAIRQPAVADRSSHITVEQLPLLAFPDRLCRLRDREKRTGTMVGGGGVRLAGESAVMDGDLFVAVEARHDPRAARGESLVRIASKVDSEWLEQFFPHLLRRETTAEFDASRERVVGVSRTLFVDLPIADQPNAAVADETAASVLAEALAPRARELIQRDERAANLIARIELLRTVMPEHPWPRFDDAELRDLIRQCAAGKRAAAEITSAALGDAIQSRLVYPLDRLLTQHAPEWIEVPSGNRIRLRYALGQPPVLAVRLQELFGLPATPRIAAGRVAVKLELLGPNFRPVQVTDDLASFWKNTYPQVRKDLRARYPKHSWPEDPLTAKPQAKGGRRR